MNENKPKKEPENRRSRWIWEADDIVIIKSADQPKGKKEKPATPASPPSPDLAAPKPEKDDDRKDG